MVSNTLDYDILKDGQSLHRESTVNRPSKLIQWDGYGPITRTTVGLVAGPGALALLFILLGMLTCLYYFIGNFIPIAKCEF